MKSFFRAFFFLLLLFVVLYVGMNNTQRVEFSFPLLLKTSVTPRAAILFFAAFAIGVLAGLALHTGGMRPSAEGRAGKK